MSFNYKIFYSSFSSFTSDSSLTLSFFFWAASALHLSRSRSLIHFMSSSQLEGLQLLEKDWCTHILHSESSSRSHLESNSSLTCNTSVFGFYPKYFITKKNHLILFFTNQRYLAFNHWGWFSALWKCLAYYKCRQQNEQTYFEIHHESRI